VPAPGTPEAAKFMESHLAWQLPVDAAFLPTMRVKMVRGRGLLDSDNENTERVAVINRALAEKLFHTEDAVGRRFRTGLRSTSPLYEVVGVSENARYTSMRRRMPPTMYLPYRQQMAGPVSFAIRTDNDPEPLVATVREVVRGVDPDLPLLNVRTQQAQIAISLGQERLFARLAVLLGTVTLLLSAVGLYGLLAYSVTRRTPEIGIRMALGAERAAVRWMILKQSLKLAATGLVFGLAGAIAATRLVESLLYQLPPRDPRTFAGAALVMLLASALAGYLPARRASKVDPLVALRAE
jgi:predicted permease